MQTGTAWIAREAAVVRPTDLDAFGSVAALSPYLLRAVVLDCAARLVEAAVTDTPPASLDELSRSVLRLPLAAGPSTTRGTYWTLRVPVWSGASDRTVWGSARANYLFRAWHDSHHLALGAPFDARGEAAACRYAQSRIRGAGPSADFARAVLDAEIVGQAFYFARWGAFPTDQVAFVLAWLECGEGALDNGPR